MEKAKDRISRKALLIAGAELSIFRGILYILWDWLTAKNGVVFQRCFPSQPISEWPKAKGVEYFYGVVFWIGLPNRSNRVLYKVHGSFDIEDVWPTKNSSYFPKKKGSLQFLEFEIQWSQWSIWERKVLEVARKILHSRKKSTPLSVVLKVAKLEP